MVGQRLRRYRTDLHSIFLGDDRVGRVIFVVKKKIYVVDFDWLITIGCRSELI